MSALLHLAVIAAATEELRDLDIDGRLEEAVGDVYDPAEGFE